MRDLHVCVQYAPKPHISRDRCFDRFKPIAQHLFVVDVYFTFNAGRNARKRIILLEMATMRGRIVMYPCIGDQCYEGLIRLQPQISMSAQEQYSRVVSTVSTRLMSTPVHISVDAQMYPLHLNDHGASPLRCMGTSERPRLPAQL